LSETTIIVEPGEPETVVTPGVDPAVMAILVEHGEAIAELRSAVINNSLVTQVVAEELVTVAESAESAQVTADVAIDVAVTASETALEAAEEPVVVQAPEEHSEPAKDDEEPKSKTHPYFRPLRSPLDK
jgi:hypothetical protein